MTITMCDHKDHKHKSECASLCRHGNDPKTCTMGDEPGHVCGVWAPDDEHRFWTCGQCGFVTDAKEHRQPPFLCLFRECFDYVIAQRN